MLNNNKTRNNLAIILLLTITFFSLNSNAATFMPLGDLPGGNFESYASAISANGEVVIGKSSSQFGRTGEAYRWSLADGMAGLGYLIYGDSSEAKGINADASEIAGWSESVTSYGGISTTQYGFSWTSTGGMKVLLSYIASAANGVNNGVRYGWSGSSTSDHGAYLWYADATTKSYYLSGWVSEARDITDDGSTAIIWTYKFASTNLSLLWNPATGTVTSIGDLPGGVLSTYTKANAISGDGATVIGVSESSSGYEAFRWTLAGGITSLGNIPGTSPSRVEAYAVSEDGTLIAGKSTVSTQHSAFIWDTENGMRDLQSVLQTQYGIDLNGWQLQEVTGVSAAGNILVGTGINPNGDTEAWVVSLEPTPPAVPADVDLSINSSNPGIIHSGSQSDYLFTVTNNSVDIASDVVVDISISGPIAYTSSTASQGSCVPTISGSTCTLGALSANGTTSVTLTVAGTGPGTATVDGTVSTSDNEINPNDNFVSRITPVNDSPAINIIAPVSDTQSIQGDAVIFQATANDTENGDISSNIVWSSTINGVIGTGGELTLTTLSVGVHAITASITDSSGATETSSITITIFEILNDIPLVSNVLPISGAQFNEGDQITISAIATDTEDGTLTSNIQWSSNISGSLGIGSPIVVALPVGTHTITASVVDSNGATGSANTILTVNADKPPISYCTASGNSTTYEWNQSFSLNGISTITGNNTGYIDNTFRTPINVIKGINSITLTPGFRSSTYVENWGVWVDFNKNGIFDTIEQLYTGSSSTTLNGSIDIPSTALTGQTRMRVVMRWGGTVSACGTFTYGEVEDYTLDIN